MTLRSDTTLRHSIFYRGVVTPRRRRVIIQYSILVFCFPMKRLLLLILVASLSLSASPAPYYRVKFVYDGDTILLETGEQVRYLGIDTPEVDHERGKSEFMAHEAWALNRKLVQKKQVRLEIDREQKDRYGRYLAYVFLKDGKLVNQMMIQEGLAHVMVKTKKLKHWELLLESQRKAMKKKIGIWSKRPKNREKIYLGNRNSFRFHRPDCHFGVKISPKNLKKYKARNDAFREGYSPCRHCKP